MLTESKYLPVNTRNTAVRVRGILRCAKVHYRTRTRGTRFKNTAGLPVPVLNPSSVTGCTITALLLNGIKPPLAHNPVIDIKF
jgi:hypothetical protein